jgi:hypothetical protein
MSTFPVFFFHLINFFIVLVEKSAFINIAGDSNSLFVILITDFISAP